MKTQNRKRNQQLELEANVRKLQVRGFSRQATESSIIMRWSTKLVMLYPKPASRGFTFLTHEVSRNIRIPPYLNHNANRAECCADVKETALAEHFGHC